MQQWPVGTMEGGDTSGHLYRVAKKFAQFLYALTLPNINRFSKLFHCHSQEKIFNNTLIKGPTTPQLCCYTTL